MKRYTFKFVVDCNAPKNTMLDMQDVLEVQLEFLNERDNCVCKDKVYPYTIVHSSVSIKGKKIK